MNPAAFQRQDTHTSERFAALIRVPAWLLILGVFSLTGLLQFVAVDWSKSLSIYDEVPHVDYVLRLAGGNITTWDDVYSQRTLGLASCLEIRSSNPQCMTQRLRAPEERWPNGHSYEAWQAPLGYMPFVAVEVVAANAQANHFAQIRQLRLANVAVWLALSGVWTMLILQVTQRRLPAAAASVVVALNPLLFDRFTYVTNDGMSIVAATGVAAWLLFSLRRPRGSLWLTQLLPSVILGTVLGLIKPTAMIVLVPIALAVALSRNLRTRTNTPLNWWVALAVMTVFGVASSFGYQRIVDARSRLDHETVLSVILPRGPLDFATASLLRINDLPELVIGTGARTDAALYEWGVRASSIWIVLFALAGAAAFIVSLSLRSDAFARQPALDTRIWALGVLAGFVAILVAHPALHYVRGEFLMPFTAGRFLAPLIPLAGLALLPTFQRFRKWAWSALVIGLLIAAFASAPINAYLENIEFLI